MKDYIPKVHIIHAGVFDNNRRQLFKDRDWPEYPDYDQIASEVEEVATLWARINNGDFVIKQLKNILTIAPDYDLEFYVFGGGFRSMSVPLLLSLYKPDKTKYSSNELIEILIHEIIHRFIGTPRKENAYNTETYWDYMTETYKDYSRVTKNHFLVYAVLEKILPLVLSEEITKKLLDDVTTPGYDVAIATVREKGPDHFIQEFLNHIT